MCGEKARVGVCCIILNIYIYLHVSTNQKRDAKRIEAYNKLRAAIPDLSKSGLPTKKVFMTMSALANHNGIVKVLLSNTI